MSRENKMQKIKDTFQMQADEHDDIMQKIIPFYKDMLDALVTPIHFGKNKTAKFIDLGCGTGSVAKKILSNDPEAFVTCLDISQNMIEKAKLKLSRYKNVDYLVNDFYKFGFEKKFDYMVSSLALHHLVTDEDKIDFYKKIYTGLEENGIFINADVVLASDDITQEAYMEKWMDYMSIYVSTDEISNVWIPRHYEEDKPASLENHLAWMKDVGFTKIDVIWKYYNFVVYKGEKFN